MYISFELVQILNLGFEVFPCFASGENTKSPMVSGGFHTATNDRDLVEAWFKTHIGCAWGVRTYATIGVLDVDSKPGKVGGATLAGLLKEHGNFPDTPTVRTGSGGWHYWFRFPEGTRSRNGFLPDLDCKADGGYVIAPPSKLDCHADAYRWLPGKAIWEMPIAVAPDWLVALIREGQRQRAGVAGEALDGPSRRQEAKAESNPWIYRGEDDLTGEGVSEGCRAVELLRRVGVHLARGEDWDDVRLLTEDWASRCTPPIDEAEASRLTESVIRKEMRQRRSR